MIGRYAWYNVEKTQRDFGLSPRPLEETLRDALRWLSDRGEFSGELTNRLETRVRS